MPLNIPMPELSGTSFLKGLSSGGNLFTQIMHPVLEREKQKQLEAHFQEQLKLSKSAAGRAALSAADAHKLAQYNLQKAERENNPQALFEFIQQIKNQAQMQSGQQQGGMQGQQQTMNPFTGQGMPSTEEMENPTQPQNTMGAQTAPNENQGGVFGNLSPDEQMALQMAGIKIPTIKENPEQKRFAELRDKIQLENYKTEQKKILEQEKTELKNVETRQKTIEAAKNDLPQLETTLKALENMKEIAKNNPDLFGHSGLFGIGADKDAERFSKTTKNPNAGAWQIYGLNPIIAAEMKMSSKGNQLALKTALANKANFSEKQPVALSKIDASIEQVKQSIAHTKSLIPETGDKSSEQVVVIDPNGKRFKTTKANAAHLPKGWKNG